MLHSRRIPVLGILYYHPANPYRFGHVKNDTTPWANVLRAVGGCAHILRRRRGARLGWAVAVGGVRRTGAAGCCGGAEMG